MNVVMLHETPKPTEAKERNLLPYVVTRVFTSTRDDEDRAHDFVRAELLKRYPQMNEGEREEMVNGFAEIYANALYHGNLGLPGKASDHRASETTKWNAKSIVVTMKSSAQKVEITVQDEGKGFELDQVRQGIADVLGEGILANHHRGLLMIRRTQYGSPVKVEFIKDPNEPVPDDEKKVLGTRATLTREFAQELPVMEDVDDYIVEA